MNPILAYTSKYSEGTFKEYDRESLDFWPETPELKINYCTKSKTKDHLMHFTFCENRDYLFNYMLKNIFLLLC